MDETSTHTLLTEPSPTTLQAWCWQTLLASYPIEVSWDIWASTLEYLGWLDNLPTLRYSN